ncbi:hypothetical protein Tco_0951136 [Tanacetum coccineum]|uniref:Growth-regulating factor n=1 Tax=Tanacetum coccineum TaxID=301880 RepID=A0ABQ5DW11_9ASTR
MFSTIALLKSRPYVERQHWLNVDLLQVAEAKILRNARLRSSVHKSPRHTAPLKGTSSDVCETSSTCRKRKSQPENDSHGLQMHCPSAMRNVMLCGFTDFIDSDYEDVRQPNPSSSTMRKSLTKRNVRPQSVADQYNGLSSSFAYHMGSTSNEQLVPINMFNTAYGTLDV